MRTSAIITAGALALVLAAACGKLPPEKALQGIWEISWEETMKPKMEQQQLKGWSDESLRTALTNRGINVVRMDRKQMEEEIIKEAAREQRVAGEMPRTIFTFSGGITTVDTIALNGARSTEGSGPFTADGAAIMWNGKSYPYTLKGNTLTMDVDGTRMIFYKTKQP